MARATWLARWQRDVTARCDVLLLPVAPYVAPMRSWYAPPRPPAAILEYNGRLGSYTPAFNYLRLPVVSVPLGHTIGVQVVAAPGGDRMALGAAAALEAALRD